MDRLVVPQRKPLADGNINDALSQLLDFTQDGKPSRAAVAGRRRGTLAPSNATSPPPLPLLPPPPMAPPTQQSLPPPSLPEGHGIVHNGRRRNSSDDFAMGGARSDPLAAAALPLDQLLFPTAQTTPRKMHLRNADTRPLWLRTPDGVENQRR